MVIFALVMNDLSCTGVIYDGLVSQGAISKSGIRLRVLRRHALQMTLDHAHGHCHDDHDNHPLAFDRDIAPATSA
jgi:hypothetical protein